MPGPIPHVSPYEFGPTRDTINALIDQVNALPQVTGPNLLFAQLASVTVANSAAETSLIGAVAGSLVIPAGSLAVGDTLKLSAFGFHSAVANPSMRVRAYLGATVILDTGVVASGNSANALWDVRANATLRQVGAGGQLAAQGFYTESAGGVNLFGMVNLAAIGVDTTADLAFNLTAQWGVASPGNTITCSNLILEKARHL